MATLKGGYHTADGNRVPSVTTILGRFKESGGLIHWAWMLGKEGKDYREVRDKAADAGTLGHYLIACYLKGEQPDTSEFSPALVSKAENSQISFHSWEGQHRLKTIFVEKQIVSERHRYGGTIDWYGLVDDKATLVDYKTGKAIYDEALIQVAAYANLLMEHGALVEQIRILRIGTEAEDGFTERVLNNWQREFRIFRAALLLYRETKRKE